MQLSAQEFILLRDLIRDICGIALKEDKQYLIMQRLEPLAKAHKCSSFAELYQLLKAESLNTALREKLVEAITTNETSFFRDGHPYETLRSYVLPHLVKHHIMRRTAGKIPVNAKIKIWSAASSTGQEPYSIAMTIAEFIASGSASSFTSNDFRILGTDISNEVLSKAIAGTYNQVEISRGISPELRQKYFVESKGNWHVSPKLKEMVEFKPINLVKPFGAIGIFDMIVCRNVLIYFDDKTKAKILETFYDMLHENGILLLGAMENTYCLTDKFKSFHAGKTILYEKRHQH